MQLFSTIQHSARYNTALISTFQGLSCLTGKYAFINKNLHGVILAGGEGETFNKCAKQLLFLARVFAKAVIFHSEYF